ncbi:hypothetical protein ACWAT4_10555 [Bradyrhizobium manausense]
MKARILDKDALQAITPAALRAYVVYEGWQRFESFGQYSEVYVNPRLPQTGELLIPISREIADYGSSIGDALTFLSKAEQRDELAIFSDIVRADRDVVRIRAPEADDDGSINVDSGAEIVQHSRDLLASAACAAFDPRRAYHLGKVQQAQEYMRRVRLGQTEHGSFVITLLAPMPPSLSLSSQTSLWPNMDDEPYERKVTRFLSQGLHSARRAILESNRGDGLEAFSSAVALGVSANLCEAIASIVEQADGADFSITWAKTRPGPKPRDSVVFRRADGEILKEAARQFRIREPRHDERLIGYVTHLHREEDEFVGRVTIKAIIDGRARSLATQLSKLDYDVAVLAHQKQLPITVLGDIEMEGQRWRLSESRDIRILDDEETS